MSFIANDPEPTIDPEDPSEGTIAGDGFWPDVDLAHLKEVARISTIVTDLALRDAAIAAILSVRRELRAWRAAREAEGKATLAAIDPATIAGKLVLEHHYLRAVTGTVAADLLDTRQEIGATGDGRDRADACEVPGPDWRRFAVQAVRDITGATRVRAALL